MPNQKTIRFFYTHLIPLKARALIEKQLSPFYPPIFDQKKFIFIHIPKTAGKSIEHYFGIKRSNHLTYLDYKSRIDLSEYYTFSLVRQPENRLISAWNYLSANGNHSKEDINLRKKYVTPYKNLDDFIQKELVKKRCLGELLFKPQTDFLVDQNGMISENINIFKMENINQLIPRLPKRLKNGDHIPHVNSSQKSSTSLSKKSLEIIELIYKNDFLNFNYPTLL